GRGRALALGLRRGLLALAEVDLGDAEVRALAGEGQADGPADVGAAARHDDALVSQVQFHPGLLAIVELRAARVTARASPRDGLAAVEAHGLPGHEVRRRRGQVDGEGTHLLRRADAPGRHLGQEEAPRLLVGHRLARDLGVDVARREAVDLDAVARPLDGEAPREGLHRALARAVGGVAGHPDPAVHRA